MNLELVPLAKSHALAILSWHYPKPYDVYSFHEDSRHADLADLLNPQNAFFAMLNQHKKLEGFCSFGADGQVPGGDYSEPALDIGMGIRPNLVGQGNGKRYATAVAAFGSRHYESRRLRVTIAAFNLRAQRVWRSLGFETVQTFYKTGNRKTNNREQFVVMVASWKYALVGD